MVEVRHGTAIDVAEVLNVWADAEVEPTVTDDEAGLVELLGHAPDALLLAVDTKRIVGTLIVGWDGWRGSFYRLAVIPARRREGIAGTLVARGEEQLVRSGARRLAVFAVTGDPGAVQFWQAASYELQADRQRLVKNCGVLPH